MIDPARRVLRIARRKRLVFASLMGAWAFNSCLVPCSHLIAQSPERLTPVVKAIARNEQTVVNIQGHKTINAESANGSGESLKQTVNGMGTGVIIDSRGYIVTNLHVVQDVPRIEVTLADGKTTIARLINYDTNTDLALIKIDVNRNLPVVTMGSSADLMQGEPVIAIGNPFGYNHTATNGIITAIHRNIPVNGSQEYHDLIQTNADINPGNSGGPLLNIEGKLIGINVAVRIGAQGIGFAIPIDAALDVMADLVATSPGGAANHGMSVVGQGDNENGQLVVKSVSKSGAAADAGIQAGDRIDRIDGRDIRNRLDLELALLNKPRGQEIGIEVVREGESLAKSIVLTGTSAPMRSVAQARVEPEHPVSAKAWEMLGVRLQAVAPTPAYPQGGLKVLEIRRNGPAAREQLQTGDILVGLLGWHTSSWDDLSYILSQQEFVNSQSAKFYVVRNAKTYVGAITPITASRRTR